MWCLCSPWLLYPYLLLVVVVVRQAYTSEDLDTRRITRVQFMVWCKDNIAAMSEKLRLGATIADEDGDGIDDDVVFKASSHLNLKRFTSREEHDFALMQARVDALRSKAREARIAANVSLSSFLFGWFCVARFVSALVFFIS